MDNSKYNKWSDGTEEGPRGHWGRWRQKSFWVALAVVAAVLWALVLSILLFRASKEREELLDHQDLLSTNASKQEAELGVLQNEVKTCRTSCSVTQAHLQTTQGLLGAAQTKLQEQQSVLSELRERVTKDMQLAGRDLEDIRSELLRALEAAKLGNHSCEPCPTSWMPFQGSCYLFSKAQGNWDVAEKSCADASARLVIVGDLEEQTFLSANTRGFGFWMGLKAVRHKGTIKSYEWVDGVKVSFSHWNVGEPNDSQGGESCIMMLDTGMWNDAPCNTKDNWICEKRRRC
ncbi:PREDICTED: C-type lectin domain family 4 member G-like [Chrysochloris asiatica]|uniref:C-type lectin domain family 4 member G-like n=1 Tax=Chrysochloris asiatica TaxID=185453 RepID=A0A9B0WVZ6_CHRAS|nr:PREDICTED: C-type lectin domain family 4 member G-like [Chrysochloris asiatica]